MSKKDKKYHAEHCDYCQADDKKSKGQQAKCDNKHCKKKHGKKKSRHLVRKAIGLGLLGTATTATVAVGGAWSAWQYVKAEATNRRRHTPEFNNIVTANTYCGMVHKNADEFTLTTASKTYHVIDKLAIIEKLAKERNAELAKDKATKDQKVSDYYDFEVSVLAELSPKGRYGYLGHLDYQLNIVGVPDKEESHSITE